MRLAFDPVAAREALSSLPEVEAQESLQPPNLSEVYVPAHHAKALSLDASIVVGMRGAGKSWWTAVLASQVHRDFVYGQLPGKPAVAVKVEVGFGLDETEKSFPRAETLNALLDQGLDALTIWRTVVLCHAGRQSGRIWPWLRFSWRQRVEWVREHDELANNYLSRCDEALALEGSVLLVLFDAFDRLSLEWDRVRILSSAALRLCLQLRSRRAIRLKFFIRPDLEEDDELWRFPDSSKLRHAKVDLSWSSTDLYGLVFMRLGNANAPLDFALKFRNTTARELGQQWAEDQNVHLLPQSMMRDPEAQRTVLEALADEYMGRDRKRGITYRWIPLHLADAASRISPRSYLLAFKHAAEFAARERISLSRALPFNAIQEGVIQASEIRVRELAEDYPWVRPLLEAARGTVVPITVNDLVARWTSDYLGKMSKAAKSKLPPRRYASDPVRRNSPEALIDDLVGLAVLYRTTDGRLNMPDIFRVGVGIRRKGGVKPPR